MKAIRWALLCGVSVSLLGCSSAMRKWYADGMPLPSVMRTSGPLPGVSTSPSPAPNPAPEATPEPEPALIPADPVTRLRSADKNVVLSGLHELGGDDTATADVRSEYNRLLQVQGWSKVKLEVLDNISYLDDGRPHVQALGVALRDADPEVREEACCVLEDMERKPAVDVLIANLSNPHADTRTCCREALEWLTDKEFRTQAEWQAWWQQARAGFTF